MATWDSVINHPAYKELTPEQQEQTRQEFFRREIAPKVPPNQLAVTYQAFEQRTKAQGPLGSSPTIPQQDQQPNPAEQPGGEPDKFTPMVEGMSANIASGFNAMYNSPNSSLKRLAAGPAESFYQLTAPFVVGSIYGATRGTARAAGAFMGGASLEDSLALFSPSVMAGMQSATPEAQTPMGQATVEILGELGHYLETAGKFTGDLYFNVAGAMGYTPEAQGAAGAMGRVMPEALSMILPYKGSKIIGEARRDRAANRAANEREAIRESQRMEADAVVREDAAIEQSVLKEIDDFNQNAGIIEAEDLPRNSAGAIMKAPDSMPLLPFSVWKEMWYNPTKAEKAGVAARDRLRKPGEEAEPSLPVEDDFAMDAYRYYAQNVYDYNVAKTHNMLAQRSNELSMRSALDDHLAALMKKESQADSTDAGITYAFDTEPPVGPSAPRGPADRPMVVRRGGQDGPLVPRMENKVPVQDPKGAIESFKGEFGMDYIPPLLTMSEWLTTRFDTAFKPGSKTANAIEASKDAKGRVVLEAVPKKYLAQIKRKYGTYAQRQLTGEIDTTGKYMGQRDLIDDMIVGEYHRSLSERQKQENLRQWWEEREMAQSAVRTAQIETMWAERGHYTIESRIRNEIDRSNNTAQNRQGSAIPLGQRGRGKSQAGMFKFDLDEASKNLAKNLDPENIGKLISTNFASIAENRRKLTPEQTSRLRDVTRDTLVHKAMDGIFYQSHSMLQKLATKHPVMRDLLDTITEPAMSVTRKRAALGGNIYKGRDVEVNQKISFREAKDFNKGTWLAELDKAFSDLGPKWFSSIREIGRKGAALPRSVNDQLVAELVGKSPMTRKSQQLRDALDKIYFDTKGAGVPVEEYLKNYLPLQFRELAFATVKQRDGFQRMLIDKYKWDSVSAEKLTEQIAFGDFNPIKMEKAADFNRFAANKDKDGTFGRKTAAEFHRNLKDVKWDDLAPYIETDLGNLLFNYVEGMATRKAMAERFGPRFEKVHEALTAINKEMATKGDQLTPGEIARVYDILDAMQSTYQPQKSRALRGLSYGVTTATHWALLPFSAIASLQEVAFAIHRAGVGPWAKAMPPTIKAASYRAARSIYRDIPKTDLEMFTDALGKTFDQTLLHRAEEMFSGAGASGSQLLFKANFQNTVTAFSHLLAAEVFRQKLNSWGKVEIKGGPKNPISKAQHETDRLLLNNLGIDTATVVDFVKSGKDLRTEAPAVLKLGALRWANLQVLQRDPAKLPLPFSSQGALMRTLHTIQTFPAMFGIQHSKQWVMDVAQNADIAIRGGKKYGLDNEQRAMAALAGVNGAARATATIAALLAISYLVVDLRDLIRFGGENPRYAGKNPEEVAVEKMLRSLNYTGMGGRLEQIAMAPYEAVTTHRQDVIVSGLGAPIQAAAKLGNTGISSFTAAAKNEDWRYTRPFFKAVADYTPLVNIRADAKNVMANALSGNKLSYKRGKYGGASGRKNREGGSFASSPFSSGGGSFSSNF